jgi:Reductase C-terminal/Pyridine nucleotide-disulphide oxidoreductase
VVKSRVRSGKWQQLYPGVYSVFTGPPDRRAQLWAAVHRAGPGAVLSYETAAELNRLIDKPSDRIHVTVPASRRVVAIPGIAIHLSGRVSDATQPCREPPRTMIEETVLDLTQVASSFDDVCAWVTRAFGRRLTNEERLRAAIGVRKKLRWRAELDELVGAAVGTSAGTELAADVVIVGVGAVPNDELAAQAELDVDNGIVADAALRTSDPDILAAGDVASSFRPLYGRRIRVEHWHNALAGGPAAARSMVGESVIYDPVPYFYSDQYDLSMETAGLPFPGTYDQVVYRGDRAGLEFIAFWLQSGTVVAGMNVNVWDVTDDIQALIRSGRKVDLTRLTDPSIPLTDL